MISRLAVLLGFAAAAYRPGAAYAEPAVVELREFDARHLYFHPEGEPLCFTKSGSTFRTNAAVVGFYPASGDDAARASAQWYVWLDARGHAHTLDVLKRQLAFYGAYFRHLMDRGAPRPGECDFDGCRLRAGRKEPLLVPSRTPTGILDRDTLLIPYYTLAFRLDGVARKAAEQPQRGGALHGLLGRKVDAALAALEALKTASELPLRRPTPPPASAGRRTAKTIETGVVLKEWELPPWLDASTLGPEPSCFRPKENTSRPETAVEESTDPQAPDFQARVDALEQAHRLAEDAVETAEFVAHEILEDGP